MSHKLAIIAEESGVEPTKASFTARDEARAIFNRRWLEDPEQFNSQRNALERERIERIKELIDRQCNVAGKNVVDLGCGDGELAQYLTQRDAKVDAVDVADNCLKRLQERSHPDMTLIQDYMPRTLLQDDHYDLVVAADLIASLKPQYFRLFMSELSRLVKKEGWVLCSTAVDIDSEDALEKFIELIETEFVMEHYRCSYHYLYLKILKALRPLKSLVRYLEQNRYFLLWMEKISKWLWSDSRISHIAILCKRKPLIMPDASKEKGQMRKGKRQVWE